MKNCAWISKSISTKSPFLLIPGPWTLWIPSQSALLTTLWPGSTGVTLHSPRRGTCMAHLRCFFAWGRDDPLRRDPLSSLEKDPMPPRGVSWDSLLCLGPAYTMAKTLLLSSLWPLLLTGTEDLHRRSRHIQLHALLNSLLCPWTANPQQHHGLWYSLGQCIHLCCGVKTSSERCHCHNAPATTLLNE